VTNILSCNDYVDKKQKKLITRGKDMNKLPFEIDINKIHVLQQLSLANHAIGELKGMVKTLPNPELILSLVTLNESKDSSAIENIITTYDEIYKELITLLK